MRVRPGLLVAAMATLLSSLPVGANPSPAAVDAPPSGGLASATEARRWLDGHGLVVGPLEEDGASGLIGTRDGLEVRMTIVDDLVVRSDLEYTTGTLIFDQAAREEVIFPWRQTWAAEASPYVRIALEQVAVPTTVTKVPLQVPTSDRTYGIDLFDMADSQAVEDYDPDDLDDAKNLEWVAVRPAAPEVLDATMTSGACVEGAFPIEIGPGPMSIDYRVTLGEVGGEWTPWLMIAIMPGPMFDSVLDVTVGGSSVGPVHLAGNAVAFPIAPGHTSTFTLEQGYTDALNGHMALVVALPEALTDPTEADLLGAVAASGFGWGRLLSLLCQPSAYPMPPAPGPVLGWPQGA